MNYRITLAYDGTAYQGWQLQEEKPTIQRELMRALQRIEGQPVVVHGAGRTDSGVHAEGQVVSFHLSRAWEAWKLRAAINGNLPRDIRVLDAESVTAEFHARFSAQGKTYRYQLFNAAVMNPFLERYAWHYPARIHRALLAQAGQLLLGTHDFAAFTVAACDTRTTVRTLTDFRLAEDGSLICLWLRGNGFLRYMVRRMVSTLLMINRRGQAVCSFEEVAAVCQQTKASAMAPAKGLTLMKVEY